MKFNYWFGALLVLLAGSVLLLSGPPTPAERRQFDVLKSKAEKGDAEAQLQLAYRYANGDGVARDAAKAVKWLRKAADQGSARAQCQLALYYASGTGVKPDKFEGAHWLRRAADQGLAEAQFNLGICYAQGEGVQRDAVTAAEWYRKAADQGLPQAEAELGNCYLEGQGVPKDIPEGVNWTRKAAEQGYAPAQNTLGHCYSKGKGVSKDYVAAYKWFNLAAAKGGQLADDARVSIAGVERYLTAEQVAEGQRLAREFKPLSAAEARTDLAAASTATTQASAASIAAAAATGLVNVIAADTSGEIFVDGAFVGNTPAKVKLREGAHVVEVKQPGFKDYRKRITVTAGSELTLHVALERQ